MRHLRRPLVLLPLLLPALQACSGGGDPAALTQEGYAALASSDYRKAADTLTAALDRMPPEDPKHLQAKVGLCRALAHVDAPRCTRTFEELVRVHAGEVELGDVEVVVKELTDAKRFAEASQVLETARAAFPESPKIAALVNEVGDKAQAAGDSDALKALEGLGYAGGE